MPQFNNNGYGNNGLLVIMECNKPQDELLKSMDQNKLRKKNLKKFQWEDYRGKVMERLKP
jgi:hypothetical protein